MISNIMLEYLNLFRKLTVTTCAILLCANEVKMKDRSLSVAFGEQFNWLLLISTSNDDQPIQVQTAACCHCSVHLLRHADLIDTPTEQIKTTFKRANKYGVILESNRNMSRIRGQQVYQPWFLYEARTSFVISSVLFANSP